MMEETATGARTTHCTNGIVVQRPPSRTHDRVEPQLQSDDVQRTPATSSSHPRHRRSIQCPPAKELMYVAGARAPQRRDHFRYAVYEDSACLGQAKHLDQLYVLLRCPDGISSRLGRMPGDAQIIPAWSAFNAAVSQPPPCSTLGYLPVIPSSPTELATVHEAMERSCALAKALRQEHVIITMDQAVYCKAQEIRWKHPEKFRNVVLRMGAFHTANTFLAVLGKRFGDAGLQDIMVESGVVAAGSVDAVLGGRHYNRGVRAHKIVWEAFSRLRWRKFEAFMDSNGTGCQVDFKKISQALKDVRRSCTKDRLTAVMGIGDVKALLEAYEGFCKEQSSSQPLFSFWSSYLEMVELLLAFLRATREGNWQLHVACLRKFLPWFYAYDRVNYARYMTIYCSEMERLQSTHPAAYNELQRGGFVVQRSKKSAFAQVAVDHAIEQTINRDMSMRGRGTVGFSLQPGAVHRWTITAHERAAIAQVCRQVAGMDEPAFRHRESGRSAIARHDGAVNGVVSLLESFQDPFDDGDALINISSGLVASPAVCQDLLSAFRIGETALKKFIEERLSDGSNSTLGFYDTLAQTQLKTFSSMGKESTVKVDKAKMVLKADRGLFARLVVIAPDTPSQSS